MTTPRFLMGAALILWGWQTGFIVVAAAMAALLEASRFMAWRWEVETADLNRIWDLCSILLIGAVVLIYGSEELARSAFTFVQWLPIIFFPMMAAQAFGTEERIEVRTFTWLLRDKQGELLNSRINVSHLYFALCLMSASATNQHSGAFYLAFAVLVSWALWDWRPPRVSRVVCAAVILVAVVSGHFAHQRLQELQGAVETALGHAIATLVRRDTDGIESRTSIGHLGRLKLSGRIMWRVEAGGTPPGLLREAAYTIFRGTVWQSTQREFASVPADRDDSWTLIPGAEPERRVTIAGHRKRNRGILPLPNATVRLNELPVFELEHTPLGVVRGGGGPGFVRYDALYSPAVSGDAGPGEDDLHVPEREQETIERIVRSLGLESKPLDEKLATVARFFRENFEYAAYITKEYSDGTGQRSPLAIFLETHRSGHCEYFATATVLLLRAANVPARYATGYAVLESERQGNVYVVRERHGHAWALVHRDGVWMDFDTTPPSWEVIENSNATAWESVSDFFSSLRFHFSKWRWSRENYRQYLIWAVIPLVAVLAWRILRARNKRRLKRDEAQAPPQRHWPGLDSEFYLLEQELAGRGAPRLPGETVCQWIRRLEASPGLPPDELHPVLQLHYRYRFDPEGINATERLELQDRVARCLARERDAPRRPAPASQ